LDLVRSEPAAAIVLTESINQIASYEKLSSNHFRILAVLTLLPASCTRWLSPRWHASPFMTQRAVRSRCAAAKRSAQKLLAQKTESSKYFWPRPSAADYATIASGASNKGPTSTDLRKSIVERREKFGKDAPDELLTASGSGLDPHLSPAPRSIRLRVSQLNARLPSKELTPSLTNIPKARSSAFLVSRA
jgi:hypothetical protein